MHDAPVDPAPQTGHALLTRRRLVRAAGTTAWAVPVVALAAAAPAYAVSLTMPVVAVSGVVGRHPTTADAVVDVTITFTNTGAAATALSAVVTLQLVRGAITADTISVTTPGWTASPPRDGAVQGGYDYTFTRAAGLGSGAASAQTLVFRFLASQGGTGEIAVAAPITTPTGTNTGSAGVWA